MKIPINMKIPRDELPAKVGAHMTMLRQFATLVDDDLSKCDDVDIEILMYRLKSIQRDLSIAKSSLREFIETRDNNQTLIL